MTRLCADDDAMVRQCDGDGAMVHVRYGDEAMLYISHHRYKVIGPSPLSSFLLMRRLNKMATGLHCSLQLL